MSRKVRLQPRAQPSRRPRLHLFQTSANHEEMPSTHHVGQRLSFKSALCTIRYIGSVEGTSHEKQWLGVEWDDALRGKHDGQHNGKGYFTCLSKSPTAASFVLSTAKTDPAQSFIEAVNEKYYTDEAAQTTIPESQNQIEISGKVAEEIGFDKIRRQLAQLHELKIVLVDGLRVLTATTDKAIKDLCPKIIELDLSRNLFEDCTQILQICGELEHLRSLRLNGNRLRIIPEHLTKSDEVLSGVLELEVDEMLLPWQDICLLISHFKDLTNLTASSNMLQSLDCPINLPNLTSLTLEYNHFTRLSDLSPLTQLSSLKKLLLKGNEISETSVEPLVFGDGLSYLDMSYNKVTSWSFVDELVEIFPGMTALRFSHNPIYEDTSKGSDDGFMLTLARLANLKTLNFSNISSQERTNAEMFYLYRIGQDMAAGSEAEEHAVTSLHRRYAELCKMYGDPTVVRKSIALVNPNFLEARLIKFTFYMPANTQAGQETIITKEKEIPKGTDIYRVKGIVGRMFDVRPLSLRLIWETGEWDPVAGYEEKGENSSDEEDDEEREVEQKKVNTQDETQREKGKWTRREIEIEDSARLIGYRVEGMEARVRVELR